MVEFEFDAAKKVGSTRIGNDVVLALDLAADEKVGDFEFQGTIDLKFVLEDFSFCVDHEEGIDIRLTGDRTGNVFGLNYELKHVESDPPTPDFRLLTKNWDYQLRQLPGSHLVLSFDQATTDDTSIDFTVSDFAITSKGISLSAGFDEQVAKLAWLPAIQLDLADCPLTDNISVLARHVNFHIPLPKKQTFSFLGCFDFELRAIGFFFRRPGVW